jgi:hypothetical protein
MPFRKFVCWLPETIESVLDTEALQPAEHVFMATHHPVKMFRTTLTALYSGAGAAGQPRAAYSEEQLLRDFLAPKDFAFVPILGEAGTGKSHLIRWLSVNMPETANRQVLLIPKIDTNLRDVLARILRLPGTDGPHFDEYRSRLARVATELRTEKEAREKLLNNLAVACGVNGPHGMRNLNETQEYLANNLPSLLYDPFFRRHLLKDGGVIHRLVEHTIGETAKVERLEEKRGFKEEDLPLKASESEKASAEAKEFYGYLIAEREVRQATVDWLNAQLNAAISELLELKGEALLRLMLEVREALGARGTELVLLIEDFAKLQGIDMQLLEAIIAKPQQEGRSRLCTLRTALACTTGYFRSLLQTVQTRVDFCVTLDLVPGPGGVPQVSPAEQEQFAARYLNAVRQDGKEIRAWFQALEADGESPAPVPNPCENCPHREPCHEAFGAADGMGLYPFGPVALRRMAERMSPDGFNPRKLLKEVLKHTLQNGTDDLEQGKFPTPALHEHFLGSRLSAPVRDALARLDTNPQTKPRRLALVDLWSDGTKPADLASGIHEAFDLPPLGSAPPVTPVQPTKPPPTAPATLPPPIPEHLQSLDRWQNNGEIPPLLVTYIREVLFPAIRARINWDAELLLPGHFAGSGGKPFQGRSLNFVRQTTQRAQGASVMLTIPLEGQSITDAAIALQGLILFSHHKDWSFRHEGIHGSYYLRKYAAALGRWSDEVLRQIRCPRTSGGAWDPVPAAVELLAIAARMAGRPQASRTSLADQVSALFQSLDGVETDHRSPAWKELFKAVRDHHTTLIDLVLARIPCTKGGRKVVQVIDAGQLLAPLQAVRKDWLPHETLPDDPWESVAATRKVRDKVNLLLEKAVKEEQERYATWHEEVLRAIAPETPRNTVTDAVTACIQAAVNEGVFPNALKERLQESLEAFAKVRVDQCLLAARRIREETDTGKLLGELGRSLHETMATISGFIALCDQFLDATRKRVDQEILQLQGTGELQTTHQEIEKQLQLIHDRTDAVCRGEA